jgi:hypothetical protein
MRHERLIVELTTSAPRAAGGCDMHLTALLNGSLPPPAPVSRPAPRITALRDAMVSVC